MGEDLQRRAETFLAAAAFARTVGVEMATAETGRVRLSLAYRKALAQPFGLMHGGALTTLADTAAALTMHLALPEGEECVGVGFSFHFLKGVRGGRVLAEGELLHQGRRTGVVQVRLTDPNHRLVATGQFTFLIGPSTRREPPDV